MSPDPPERHRDFAEAHHLPYPLVSDQRGTIAAAYGVQRLGGWLPHKRVTFVIGKDGIIQQIIKSELNIGRHVGEALATLRRLFPTPAS